jgi:hypothetical protein
VRLQYVGACCARVAFVGHHVRCVFLKRGDGSYACVTWGGTVVAGLEAEVQRIHSEDEKMAAEDKVTCASLRVRRGRRKSLD